MDYKEFWDNETENKARENLKILDFKNKSVFKECLNEDLKKDINEDLNDFDFKE
jgi:hypothetical protein